MKKLGILLAGVALMLSVSVVLAKNGPADMATGSVMWESLDVTRYLDFDAHDAIGNQPVKGMAYYWDENGNAFDVTVTGFWISGDEACFWGPTSNATGQYASKNGQTRYWYVVDGGEPQEDIIRGNWGDGLCGSLSTAPFDVVTGNLQVHNFSGAGLP